VDPTLDRYGLWTVIQDVTIPSDFVITEGCEFHLKDLVERMNRKLDDELHRLITEEEGPRPTPTPRATLTPLSQSEWGKRWRRELVLLEVPVAERAASEILQTEARLTLLRYLGQMMSVARQDNFTDLHEWSFNSAGAQLAERHPGIPGTPPNDVYGSA
jgi:hypothetical protein